VLIVDDEPIVRRLHEASLTGWGYQVVLASGGEQAWEMFQSEDPPELAILDWTMPGMDGLELCTRVRTLGREPKPYLIFVTAKARTQDIVTGGAGADDYRQTVRAGSCPLRSASVCWRFQAARRARTRARRGADTGQAAAGALADLLVLQESPRRP
jgi:CheY-like chemotaxis protein